MPTNYTRGRSKPVDKIIIHHTGMGADGKPPTPQQVAQSFNTSSVSAHGIIGTDGSVLHYLPKTDTAWGAAGPDTDSNNVSDINDTSIHYEFCGDGNIQPFTKAQYQAFVNEVNYDRMHFPIKEIWAHSEKTAGKVDPGKHFNWEELEAMLNLSNEPVSDNWKQYGQTWPEIASNLLGVCQYVTNILRDTKPSIETANTAIDSALAKLGAV